MKTFTKLFFVVTLISSHLLSYAGDIKNIVADEHEVKEGVTPIYKGGATAWKMTQEKQSELTLSAQNARPVLFVTEGSQPHSKIYASAVSAEFHKIESVATAKSVYSAMAAATFSPGRDLRPIPSISAYPNPSRGLTRLSLTQIGGDNYKIKVSNTIGRVMKTYELPPFPDNTTVALDMDMSIYPAGIYFYSLLVNDKTVETKRLVLQK